MPTPAPRTDASPAIPAAVTARADSARRPDAKPVATDDDLARAVVSVFGDTSALHATRRRADEEPLWDLDVRSYETHDRVAHYVQLFSTDGRERFAARLSRGTRYEPMIRAKLRASGMPEDLTYLALIESGYDPHAYSRAAAVGMWQFMSSTARDVGLRVDWWMDERRDPARATDGAIRFLGYLQKQFGSLYLAAAAYNGGPGRVARGLTRFAEEMEGSEGEDRFFALAEQDYLRAETKNYVPQLIAAALVAKMPSRYGIAVDSVAPLRVRLRARAGRARVSRSWRTPMAPPSADDARPQSGHPPRDRAAGRRRSGCTSRRGRRNSAAACLDTMPAERRPWATARYAWPATSTTPTALAAREGVTLKQLRWFNPSLDARAKGRLVSGQSVRIPSARRVCVCARLPDPAIERYGGSAASTLARSGCHVVRRGETLGGIARRYGVSVARLQSMNGLRGTPRHRRPDAACVGCSSRRVVQAAAPASSTPGSRRPKNRRPRSRPPRRRRPRNRRRQEVDHQEVLGEVVHGQKNGEEAGREEAVAKKPAAGTKPRG